MTDMKENWDDRWAPERTLLGLFPPEVRSMLDSFPTQVRKPNRFALSRLLVNPKYGDKAVLKVCAHL